MGCKSCWLVYVNSKKSYATHLIVLPLSSLALGIFQYNIEWFQREREKPNENETNFALSYTNWRFPHDSTALFDFIVLLRCPHSLLQFYCFFFSLYSFAWHQPSHINAIPNELTAQRIISNADVISLWASHQLQSSCEWNRQSGRLDAVCLTNLCITFYYWLNSMCCAP